MGCSSSKDDVLGIKKDRSDRSLHGSTKKMIIDAPKKSESFVHAGITIKYAYASQRGYYPDTPDKENQDSYSVLPKINVDGITDDIALFGVYDGHGYEGHHISRYARNQVIYIDKCIHIEMCSFILIDSDFLQFMCAFFSNYMYCMFICSYLFRLLFMNICV
jgi:hypothetical protein